MKEKLLRILKYLGIGFGGLTSLFIFLAIVLPDPGSVPEPGITQQDSLIQEEIAQLDETATEDKKADEIENVLVPTELPEQSTTNTNTEQESNQTTEPIYYKVISVVDGDTIKISMGSTVETLRLIGIDTPETVDPRKPIQCFGIEASNKAKGLLSGQEVRIESDSSQDTRDKYGRLLVYVYRSDGLFFNKYMVEQGYAYEYTYETPYKYQTDFKHAQQSAQNNQRGLWSSNTCNGDPNTGVEVENNQTTQNTQAPQGVSENRYYTSSHHSAKYYYPEKCSAWEGLSKTYLRSFNTLEELLATYSRTLSPQCQ